MLVLIWKRMLPLKSTGQRILASLCNPIAFAGIVGNLFTLLPWPLNQIDHGTESTGHLLALALGLVLLREMAKSGELKEVEIRRRRRPIFPVTFGRLRRNAFPRRQSS